MRTLLAIVLVSSLGSITRAVAAEPAVPAASNQPTAAAPAAADQRPDAWRYRWHNGQWWYYTPRQQWLVYSDAEGWKPYTAPPQPTYSAGSYRSRGSSMYEDQGHSLGATGNSPRYWLWKRIGP
jgi:hypothetical protein